jgi:hypothetical protein
MQWGGQRETWCGRVRVCSGSTWHCVMRIRHWNGMWSPGQRLRSL